eukprot:CAMPEP_0174960330 /NCGR_PEP_ID=MMETSP0004_2-20121128/3648_1 /TAXON_ID=420556 /ORGANISM="Ochromonas sp., Strain CCMP1393" /LENGTH=568 /DNA_ID=CAMNT_0016208699 /DNA_START=212 /DNA_END=1918 /DNA_ORIENTATION=+
MDHSRSKDAEDNIVFRSDPKILSTVLIEKRLRFTLKWKQWKPRIVTIFQSGILEYKTVTPCCFFFNRVRRGELDIRRITVSYIPEDILLTTLTTENLKECTGLTIKCKTTDGFDTYFRCIMELDQFERFRKALVVASPRNNVNKLGPIPKLSEEQITQHAEQRKRGFTYSVMRRTIAQAMSDHDERSRREQIIAKRGALKDLPVLFANDLIHGSWWFVVGSIGFVGTAVIALANSYQSQQILGTDDSGLSEEDYRTTWCLMVISGVFCTLGSLAFVRALHEDPPMRPLFGGWYHVQNDELLGSWLFFFATLPFIPYSLIYLANAGYHGLLFLGMLVLSSFIAVACFMFVIACYPSDSTTRTHVFMPCMKIVFRCCCSRRWLQTHLRNDWLAGVWFFYWASLAGTFGCFVLFMYVLAKNDTLKIFLLGTSLVENFFFLIGSAYFVAGSYPDGTMVIDDDFLSVSIDDEIEHDFELERFSIEEQLARRMTELSPSGHGQSFSLTKSLNESLNQRSNSMLGGNGRRHSGKLGSNSSSDAFNPLIAAMNTVRATYDDEEEYELRNSTSSNAV